MPKINVPLKPFQGTLGLAPPDGFFPPLSPGVTTSVPPGPHAGNLDLSELSEGSTLYIPVWKPGALIYTGDSHAVQGDGEISLTALETRMKELRIQVILHKQKNLAWPVAETNSHWIIIGLDKDLNAAMTMAARNAIKFLAHRARRPCPHPEGDLRARTQTRDDDGMSTRLRATISVMDQRWTKSDVRVRSAYLPIADITIRFFRADCVAKVSEWKVTP